MEYATLKLVHQTAVTLSITGFFARGIGALLDARWVRSRPARSLPHVVDTVLLLSALAMFWMLNLSLAEAPWLTAKIIGLLVYIGLGVIALRPGPPRAVRAAAWVAALATAGWIVSVAITKSALGFFGWLL